jgi:hypothetical protein
MGWHSQSAVFNRLLRQRPTGASRTATARKPDAKIPTLLRGQRLLLYGNIPELIPCELIPGKACSGANHLSSDIKTASRGLELLTLRTTQKTSRGIDACGPAGPFSPCTPSHRFRTAHTGAETFPEARNTCHPQLGRNLQTLKKRFQIRRHRDTFISPNANTQRRKNWCEARHTT